MKVKTQAPPLVFYLCDGKKCIGCAERSENPCRHTSDKRHAKYQDDNARKFNCFGLFLFEKEREDVTEQAEGINGTV